METPPASWAKQCGVCHVGGGQMEYDRDMLSYGDPASTDVGGRYIYKAPRVGEAGGGSIVLAATDTVPQLSGDNNAEVDCMMCHANETRAGAAWYTSIDCATNGNGPADDPNCNGPRFTFAPGTIYDSFNRNAAVEEGYLKQAATAGIGATIDLSTGVLSNVPATIPAASIAAVPNSSNCAQCHARNEADSIGLPGEAQSFGGMISGYGNFFRITPAGQAFDFDEIAADGTCAADCANDTQWNEFGCKTGMGKRAHKTGYGSQDRFGFGICFGCAMFSYMNGGPIAWYTGGVCAMPSVQDACNDAAGTDLQANPMAIFENPVTGMPAKIIDKMPDVDIHDAGGVKCATCHYGITATPANPIPARTISGNGQTYTYPAITDIQKIDHQVAQGYSNLEHANDSLDGTVTCAGCHIDKTHPNASNAPVPAHAGFPAIHMEKIDCRTCHIPEVYSSPGRLLFRDWTAGAFRQAEGANGNANHFDFAFNFMEGAASPMSPLWAWSTTAEGTKIIPVLPSSLPIWMGVVKDLTGAVSGWAPAKTRDITAAAALVSAANPSFGIRLNGVNEHPAFQGFQLTDPLKIDSKAKIEAMATELESTGAGYATHGDYIEPRLNLYPIFFDASHGIVEKEWALGGSNRGGCVSCHSSSDPSSSNYDPNSIGFFDRKKDILKNGMMQMADYDCGGNDAQFMAPTDNMWSNAAHPDWMCGMFDGMGPNSGACDAAEFAACTNFIGSQLFPMFGMPSDIVNAFPVDGIAMMQMQAIREGASAAGCDPRYSFFGLPNGAAHGQPGTNGCIASDYYSRDEIRLYYKKNIQQSKYTSVKGADFNRVTGTVKVAKNPDNPSHVNSWDLGATCITDPVSGSTGPCTDGGYINTSVSEPQLLGYVSERQAALMDLNNCSACHSQSLTNMNHPTAPDTPSSCATCHTTPHQSAIDIATACGQCHTSGPGPNYSTAQLEALAIDIHNTTPVANFTSTPDGTTSYKVNFSAISSICPTGYTCTYEWDLDGDSTMETSGIAVSKNYADTAFVSVTLKVTTNSGKSDSITKSVTPVEVATPPTGCEFAPGDIVVDQVNKTASFTDASSEGMVYVNWGDGSGMEIGTPGTPFGPHTYVNNGRYIVRKTVRNSAGMNCVSNQMIVINPGQGTGVTKSTVTITVSGYAAADAMTCQLKNLDEFGVTRTRYTGNGTGGSVVISGVLFDSDGTDYDVYCYLGFNPACPNAKVNNPASFTVNSDTTSVSVTADPGVCTP